MIKLCEKAIEHKVAAVPGSAFKVNDYDRINAIRLNFTTPTMEDMDRGIKVLGEVAKEMNK